MDATDFTQGMSDASALNVGTLFSDLGSLDRWNFMDSNWSHWKGLSSRPDWDGQMTYSELVKWGKENGNSPVFLAASKINLGSISANDFPGVGKGARINTVGRGAPLDTYGSWGKNYMTLMSADGKVKLSSDGFDYRQHSLKAAWSEGIKVFTYELLVRYPSISILQGYHGIGNEFGFIMHPYGNAQLK